MKIGVRIDEKTEDTKEFTAVSRTSRAAAD
jgi:hypothetical protein